MSEIGYHDEAQIKASLDDAIEKLEQAKASLDEMGYDDEVDLHDHVAVPVLLALSGMNGLVRELRTAGAEIAEFPSELEAAQTCVANGAVISQEIQASVAHLEKVMERFDANA